MKTKALLLACLALCFAVTGSFAQTTIMSDAFNNSSTPNSATGWQVQVTGATVTTPSNGLSSNSYLSSSLVNYQTVPHISLYPDYGGLLLSLGRGSPQTGGTRAFISPLYAVPSGTSRVKVMVSVKVQNVAPEDVAIALVEEDASGNQSWIRGGVNFSSPTDQSDFLRVIPAQNWLTYTKLGELRSTTVNVYVEILVRNNNNTTGLIYLDDLSIVTSTDTSYLVESYSGNEGNVFLGSTGTVEINPYDSRGLTPAFSVTNETGAAISPQPTITPTSGFYQVALPARGYYAINVTPSGYPTQTFSSAIISPTAPVATSPFGVFSVNTTNQLAYDAGCNWNRFFITTSLIRLTSGTFTSGSALSAEGSPAVPDFTLLPTNQKWQACLVNVPQFMAAVPTGQTYTTSKFYPPTSWSQFETMVEYVASNLPASVQDLEVINEPEFNWGGAAATQYSDMNMYYKTVHDAVTYCRTNNLLANPNLKVIGPSFAHFYTPVSNYNDGMVTLQNALFAGGQFSGDTGLLTYVDEIAMHGYNDSVGLQEPEAQFYDRIYQWQKYYRNTTPTTPGLTTNGTATGPLKPIHMTEYGWEDGTASGDVSELTRAGYTSRSLIITRAMSYSGIGIPFASIGTFCLRYTYQGVLEPWSMINLDETPLPTYVAYSTAAQALGGMDTTGPYLNNVPTLPSDAGCNYQCATFENSSTLYSETCLWNSSTTGATLAMHMPYSATFTATDFMGRPVTISGGGQLTLSTSPVFLRAYKFFAVSVASTITVTHATTIPTTSLPGFSDILCPSTFVIQGSSPNFTLKAPATVGTYSIMVKDGTSGLWSWYKVVAN